MSKITHDSPVTGNLVRTYAGTENVYRKSTHHIEMYPQRVGYLRKNELALVLEYHLPLNTCKILTPDGSVGWVGYSELVRVAG
jgi:hypothetical protein